jgi:uncharacterized protein YbcI
VERGGPEQTPDEQPNPRRSIQRDIIQLHKEYFGRGPVTSKLYMHEDAVILLMYEGHTPVEESLRRAGDRRSVAQARVDISESGRERFVEVVERHTGRKVVGFMTSSQQDPDLLSHIYVLQPTDPLSVVEEKAPPATG